MTSPAPLRIGIVAGEESGDLLGADLVSALATLSGREVKLTGVGGRHLEALGLTSLFDASDIALMGISAVLRDLPRLIARIGSTARAIAAEAPDCLVTIDSPDFSLRVARKVRAANPSIPIVHYVCPSVWAWRPGRALAMRPYVDLILCLLPFEPAELARLGGPPGLFVGHRLATDAGIARAAALQAAMNVGGAERVRRLLVLPGSRRGEVQRLAGPFADTMAQLRARGHRLSIAIPTVPHVAALVRDLTAAWTDRPEIILDPERKWQAFGEADAALTASGTVSLELALAGVPFVSCYKADRVMKAVQSLITVWSACLPNIIGDKAIVPEFYNEYVRPENLARQLEALFLDTPMRAWQKRGFAEVAGRMRTAEPTGKIAAQAVFNLAAARQEPAAKP
ncbi:MAG: lipid-A-disaccharide synthase [Rhizobiaceae bacterium]|nr:lipid-A-disaccharide synthase [Rhizobiaceae bacterium]